MCELLGLSSRRETTINLSLTVLAERGENPNMHGDGWGIAFHEGRDVRLIKDAGAAKNSEWVEFIKQREIHAHDIIAHIRKSTVGEVNYSNTHPFTRELLGRLHSFAHNGTLKNIRIDPRFQTSEYHPVGETDSEHAFCFLMDQMKDLWGRSQGVPTIKDRIKVVKEFAASIRQLGPANFLYSDGDIFFAHGDERHDPIQDKLIWPGLFYLQIHCDERHHILERAPESGLVIESDDDVVTLFASVPLNEANWIPLKRGELIAVSRGRILHSAASKLL
jgi:predicted glutamine amidotransferase